MANAVEFILSLKNKLTGPAMAAKKSLDTVKDSLKSVDAVTKTVERATLSAGQGFKNVGGATIKVNTAMRAVTRASGLGSQQLYRYGASTKVAGQFADFLGQRLGSKTAVGFARAHASATKFGATLPSLREMASSAGSGLMSMSGAVLGVGAAIAGLAVGGLGLAAAGAKYAAEMAGFKEQTLFAYKYVLGSSEKADMIFREADAMARAMGGKTSSIAESMRELMSGGFSATDSKTLTMAMQDVVALNPSANIGQIATQIAQMKGAGRVLQQDLKPMLDAGLNDDIFYQKLRQITGKTNQVDLKRAMESGKVDADQGIQAIVATVAEMGGNKGLGSVAAARANETMGGQIDSAKAMFERLFMSISSGPASGALGSLAKQVTAFLDPKGSSGQRILATFNAMAAGASSVLASLSGGTFGDILDGLLAGFEAVWPISKAFFGGFLSGFQEAFGVVKTVFQAFSNGKGPTLDLVAIAKAMGTAFGFVAVGIGSVVAILGGLVAAIGLVVFGIGDSLVSLVGWVGETMGEFMASMSGQWGEIGLDLVKGLANGITGGLSFVVDAAMGIGSAAVDALRSLLQIKSPSKVMAEIGGYTAEGFTMGIESGAPAAGGAMAALVAPGPLKSFGGGGGATMSGVSVYVTINADGNGDESESLADRVERVLPDALRDAFARMANELGTEPAAV